MHLIQQQVDRKRSRQRGQHRDEPGGLAVAALTAVEVVLQELQRRVQHTRQQGALIQGADLLEQQRGNQGEHSHGRVKIAQPAR